MKRGQSTQHPSLSSMGLKTEPDLMNVDVSKSEHKAGSKKPTRTTGPGSPHKAPPRFKQRSTRQFKSKPPKRGVIGFGDDIPGMEGLGTGKHYMESLVLKSPP
ncbi:retinal cone rhodopsin-sensitive cGMP 3',5'-cyclic phosphodiesterase subunit gamma-like [Clarias magur]|uniref:3',5'-cyclic-GMP phosphodiesterase n=1 Tax=Clarias magur TaxID=1594786 RepID=A0A8J4UNM1_CLAMG|nr:retinal cone rhodopsin-sensitive cGMP 3',5'-cyclic phosphodiesterase subunit gamma-like [Clarias magur]